MHGLGGLSATPYSVVATPLKGLVNISIIDIVININRMLPFWFKALALIVGSMA